MMWIPSRSAFRAGLILGNQWDIVGEGSGAIGFNNSATGDASFAAGGNNTAAGLRSIAIGDQNSATNQASIAIGSAVQASELGAIAIGTNFSTATGIYSVAIGSGVSSSGYIALATGHATTASGNYSTAMGRTVSTNAQEGSFIYGDATSVYTGNSAANQFMVRASGGTVFYSSSDLSTGVTLAAGGGAWASISDSNRKANRLNIDGEAVLNKLSNIWLGSWNYKTQDKTMRHYGPMAQEFFAAFGNDGLGVIGNDTTLATSDVDGVTLIAVKALIERNDALTSRVELLEAVIRKMAGSQDATIQKALLVK